MSRLGRTALAGALAGVGAVASNYLGSWLGILQPLPQLLQQPLLQVLPGPVFGFLIDTLQHAGKVLEEAGLILAMVVALALLAVIHQVGVDRWRLPDSAFLPAAAAWAITTLIVLPLAGEAPLGLDQSTATPLLWALVYLVYAGLLDLGRRSYTQPATAGADPGRRRLISLVPVGAALLGAGLLGYRLVPGWVQAITAPPEAAGAGVTREVTPAASFYVVTKDFQDPVIAAPGWTLGVRGLVDHPLSLTYSALQALPATTALVTLQCISNTVGGNLMSTIDFTGVPLRDLVTMARPRTAADALAFHCRDGYVETLPLAMAMGSPDIMVAYGFGGAPLPRRHGYPARILVPARYGMKSAKWLDWIELTHGEQGGYWENQGFDRQAVVRTTTRLDTPRDGSLVKLGAVALTGVAFAGDRGISAVEWSADGGRTWSPAQLQPALSPLVWTLWNATWTPDRDGAHTLVVRSRDGGGELQSSAVQSSFPRGASGYHQVRVNVFR
jgi:DMSO/TMAO reductase YedYZ molybdopterin-dependent catalytic subunit